MNMLFRKLSYENIFNKSEQKPAESFDDFLTLLMDKFKNCDFGILESSLFCDNIVTGINDDSMRERLLSEKNLT